MDNSTKPRLLYVVTQAELGGAQRYIYDLVTAPEAKNYEVAVAVGRGRDSAFANQLAAAKIPVFKLNHLVRPISPWHDILAVGELRKLYQKLQPDIIHLNSSKAGVIGSLAAYNLKITGYGLRVMGYKIIYTAHGWVFNEPMSWLKKKLYLWAEKFTAKFKNKIICVSEFDRQTAIKNQIAPKEKLITIHNGINNNINFLSPNDAKKFLFNNFTGYGLRVTGYEILIGTIANLYPTKGLVDLIKAIHLLVTGYELLVTAVIIGDGAQRPELEKLIAQYNLTDRIFLPGQLATAARYLKAFDIYVCSSLKEGFPYSILEAMAAERPIVTTKVGGIPEMISHNREGLLVKPKNPPQLAEMIKLLIDDKNYGEKLGQQAKNKVEREFSLKKMVADTFSAY